MFYAVFTGKKGHFFRFWCNKIVENAGIIRNSGIIGGRVLLEDSPYPEVSKGTLDFTNILILGFKN